jgi:hypothetical protein
MAEAFWSVIVIIALVGFLVWYYFKQNAPAGKRVRQGFAILFLVGLMVGTFYKVDEAGWIPHYDDTSVFISEDWMMGEFRVCEMKVLVPAEQGGNPDYFLDCASGQGKAHLLPVKFWGRLKRYAVGSAADRFQQLGTWKCQRKEQSLICKALD